MFSKAKLASPLLWAFFKDFMELHCGIGETGGKQKNFSLAFYSLLFLLLGFVVAEWYLRFKASHFSSASLVYSPDFFMLSPEISYQNTYSPHF